MADCGNTGAGNDALVTRRKTRSRRGHKRRASDVSFLFINEKTKHQPSKAKAKTNEVEPAVADQRGRHSRVGLLTTLDTHGGRIWDTSNIRELFPGAQVAESSYVNAAGCRGMPDVTQAGLLGVPLGMSFAGSIDGCDHARYWVRDPVDRSVRTFAAGCQPLTSNGGGSVDVRCFQPGDTAPPSGSGGSNTGGGTQSGSPPGSNSNNGNNNNINVTAISTEQGPQSVAQGPQSVAQSTATGQPTPHWHWWTTAAALMLAALPLWW